MNRIKNFIILTILIIFLYTISILPVTCFLKSVTGIYCPACGMTRAFISILNLNFLDAIYFNILSIPLFIFIIYFSFRLIIDLIKNDFVFVPNLLNFFKNYYWIILISLFISFFFNNIKN